MNKKVNKKHHIILIALALITTMLIIPITNTVTTIWLQSVDNSSNVTDPHYILGTSPDDKYARFNPTEAKLIGTLRTNPPSAITVRVYGYRSDTVSMDVFRSVSSGSGYHFIGYIALGTTKGYYTSIGSGTGGSGVGFNTYGPGYAYIDYAEFQY